MHISSADSRLSFAIVVWLLWYYSSTCRCWFGFRETYFLKPFKHLLPTIIYLFEYSFCYRISCTCLDVLNTIIAYSFPLSEPLSSAVHWEHEQPETVPREGLHGKQTEEWRVTAVRGYLAHHWRDTATARSTRVSGLVLLLHVLLTVMYKNLSVIFP